MDLPKKIIQVLRCFEGMFRERAAVLEVSSSAQSGEMIESSSESDHAVAAGEALCAYTCPHRGGY
jgi:hypothetical protein